MVKNIIDSKPQHHQQRYAVSELIDSNWNEERSVFYGSIVGYSNELFLATYSCVVLLRDPGITYSGGVFIVHEFVNINIEVIR